MTTNLMQGERCCPFSTECCQDCKRKYWKERCLNRPLDPKGRHYPSVVRWAVYAHIRVLGEQPRLAYVTSKMFRYEAEKQAQRAFGYRTSYEVVKERIRPLQQPVRTLDNDYPYGGFCTSIQRRAWEEAA